MKQHKLAIHIQTYQQPEHIEVKIQLIKLFNPLEKTDTSE
jgi:hypothetical protein